MAAVKKNPVVNVKDATPVTVKEAKHEKIYKWWKTDDDAIYLHLTVDPNDKDMPIVVDIEETESGDIITVAVDDGGCQEIIDMLAKAKHVLTCVARGEKVKSDPEPEAGPENDDEEEEEEERRGRRKRRRVATFSVAEILV
jgi:hypothetical protein